MATRITLTAVNHGPTCAEIVQKTDEFIGAVRTSCAVRAGGGSSRSIPPVAACF